MIFPELMLKARIHSAIEAINSDPAMKTLRSFFDTSDDFAPGELSTMFTDLYGDFDLSALDGMADQAIEWWRKYPPTVDTCLNWGQIREPGIYVDYGSENSEGFIGQNMTTEDSDEAGGVIHKVSDVYAVPSTVIWIMTDNKDWSILLYYILRSVLQLDWLWYTRYGLRNLQISGGNIDRSIMLPNILYPKQITLRYEYTAEVTKAVRAPIGHDYTVRHDNQDGTFTSTTVDEEGVE